jgi:ABC-type branched-subunit amino acid transport system substrate-binding protein
VTTPAGSTAGAKLAVAFVAGAVLGAVSMVSIVPEPRVRSVAGTVVDPVTGEVVPGDRVAASAGPSAGTGTNPGTGPRTSTGTRPNAPGATAAPPRPGLECNAMKNGGSTDVGVTATEIKLATTVVASGIGSAFLGEMRYAMSAVERQVNQAGGICGRRLKVEYKDDGWSAQTGAQYLRNYIQSGIFAIPVGASSEGLDVVIDSGDIDRAGIPVVGGDGLSINQYVRGDGTAQQWVWPIATATVSSARIMVNEAYARGARKFAIVFDRNYKFGQEAAAAYNAEVRRLTGKNVEGYNKERSCLGRFCGILAGQNSYANDISTLASSEADFVALFLEPQTAQTWMGDANTPGAGSGVIKYGYSAAQPLFTEKFLANCKGKCDQMLVWTGFKPNIEGYAGDPAVRSYVSELRRTKPDADTYNQFTEGAYVGMRLLVEALQKVGPDLTRQRLRAVLDAMSYGSGLTIQPTLRFTPATRYANVTMQAFTMQYKGGQPSWRTGVVRTDPRPEAGAKE